MPGIEIGGLADAPAAEPGSEPAVRPAGPTTDRFAPPADEGAEIGVERSTRAIRIANLATRPPPVARAPDPPASPRSPWVALALALAVAAAAWLALRGDT
jgi:hypothetical protein